MFVASLGYTDIATILLNAEARTDIQDLDGATSLMAANKSGHLNIVNLLLQEGADVTIENNDGHRAFHYALFSIRTTDIENLNKLDKLLEIALILREKEREVEAEG